MKTTIAVIFLLGAIMHTNAWVINNSPRFGINPETFATVADYKRALSDFSEIMAQKIDVKPIAVNQSIEDFSYFIYPTLESAIGNGVYGAFDASINGDLAITAFEGFASIPGDGIFPLFVSYSGVNNGELNKVDTVYQNFSWGSAAGSVCNNPNKRFVMEALLRAKNPALSPFVSPVDALVVIWEYHANGTWFTAPTTIYNISDAEPDLYQQGATYSGAAEFSEDCEYIIYTAALGAYIPFPFTPSSQVLGLLKVDEHLGLTKVASIAFPATGIAGYSTNPPLPAIFPVGDYLYFAQTAWMGKDEKTGNYRLAVPAPVYTLFDIQGSINGTASLFSYTFDPITNSLLQVSQLPLNQYPQGMAVSNDQRELVILTDCSYSGKVKTMSKRCKKAYLNNASDADNEVRFYEINKKAELSYSSSFELNGWGVKAAYSDDDNKLAITWAPALINALQDLVNFEGLSFSSSVVSIYDYRGSKLTSDDLRGTAGTSPLSFGIDFNAQDQLLVAGMPMLLQRDIQLLNTTSN